MSEHVSHRMHENSLASYEKARADLSTRAAQVWSWVQQHGAHTDREIMAGLGYSDPNKVRPRVTELVESGMLEEMAKRKENGRMVRVVCVPAAKPVQQALFEG